MNLDAGSGFLNCHHLETDALHCDVQKSDFVDVVCDVQNLPFKDNCFVNVYAFHLLEHVDNPIQGLRELIRVAKKKVEIEVPHWLSSNSKQESKNPFDRHLWSFRISWFHNVLRNIRHHVKVLYYFPRLVYIHVGIYPKKIKATITEEAILRAFAAPAKNLQEVQPKIQSARA